MSDREPAPHKLILVCPILPGHVEAWRRFIQELAEEWGAIHAESRAQLAICAEHIWIHETAEGALAVLAIETNQPNQMLHRMITSEGPFDSWFRQQMMVHLGIDVGISIHKYLPELVFAWQAS